MPSSILQSQAGCWEPPGCFLSDGVLKYLFVCFLPILQNRAGFCACFASHVQRFTLNLWWGYAWEAVHRGEDAAQSGGWGTEHKVCLWFIWRDLQARCPQKLMGGLPYEFCEVFSETQSPLMILSLCCCASSFFQTPGHDQHFSILGGERKKWTCWAMSCMDGWRSQVLTHYAFTPLWEKWRWLSWYWAVLPWE